MDINIAGMYMILEFLPKIQRTFREANEQEFLKYGMNCCRQSAVMGNYVLNKILPEFTWTAWEGKFDDIFKGKEVSYEHAWSFGKCDDGRRLFVDLGLRQKVPIFRLVESNRHPKESHEDLKDLKELSRTQLDWKSMLFEEEYFTKRKCINLVGELFPDDALKCFKTF